MLVHGHDGMPATPYAAPARAANLSALPPAYIATAEYDPNRDEAIDYAQRLLQAGVPAELHQWPGTFHGSWAVPSAACLSGRSPNSPLPCAAPSPSEVAAAGQAGASAPLLPPSIRTRQQGEGLSAR